MTRDEALAIVREYVKNENLIKHMYCVEATMRFYAEKLGEDVETWGQLGLLHDFDWEVHPTLEEHPVKGAPILRERGLDEELIQDILSHGVDTGVLDMTRHAKLIESRQVLMTDGRQGLMEPGQIRGVQQFLKKHIGQEPTSASAR